MPAPHILVADSNAEIAQREAEYLRGRFGRAYDVVAVGDAESAVDHLERWTAGGEPVALLVVDAALDSSVDPTCLDQARRTGLPYRVIVTSDMDHREDALERVFTERAHDAVVNSRPLEQEFDRAVSELLEDWTTHDDPALQRVTLVGPRWSKRVHDLKEYLTMSHVPFTWVDSGTARGENFLPLLEGGSGPVVILPDRRVMLRPSLRELAAALDITQAPQRPAYDVVVVGGGPAGLSTAVIAASEGRSVLVLERDAPGGQAGHSSRIENYPGFPRGISGGALAEQILLQALRLGAEVLSPVEVTALGDCATGKKITLSDGREVFARSLVLANGVQYRRLEAPGAEELIGAGIYYGASTAETRSFTGERVVVVGGANSAGQAAMDLSRVAAQVDIVIRGRSIEDGMSQYLVEQVRSRPNIRVRLGQEVAEVQGGAHVDGVTLRDRGSGELSHLDASGVFVFIGAEPRTEWLRGIVELDNRGYVVTGAPEGLAWAGPGATAATSHPGIFAIGDIRSGATRRVSAAVGQAAEVVPMLHHHLDGTEVPDGVAASEPLSAFVDLPVQEPEVIRSLLRRTFGKRGFVLDAKGDPATAMEWTLSQPEQGPAGRDLARIRVADENANGRLDLFVEVSPQRYGLDSFTCRLAVHSWAQSIADFLGERHRLDSVAQATPTRSATAVPADLGVA